MNILYEVSDYREFLEEFLLPEKPVIIHVVEEGLSHIRCAQLPKEEGVCSTATSLAIFGTCAPVPLSSKVQLEVILVLAELLQAAVVDLLFM